MIPAYAGMTSAKKVVVIGGGISGLAAAHRLCELSREARRHVEVTLLEGRDHLGGLIDTETREGFLLEGGPDAFLSEKPWALELCRRIGMEDELIQTRPELRRSLILHGGKLQPLPEGFYLVAPARREALWGCPFLSWRGKLRLACEPFIPRRSSDGDESVASFVRRRLGAEVLERIAQPMVGGIYTADLEKLSLKAALPRFHEMERQHGSVIRALRRAAASDRARVPTDRWVGDGSAASAAARAAGPRYGLFVAPRFGMSRLVEVLARRMLEVEIKTGALAEGIERSGRGWTVRLRQGQTLQADAVCVALPAHQAASLLKPIAPAAAVELEGIPYESVATVNLAFRKEDLPVPPGGLGFVVPAHEGRGVIGCTFSSVKFVRRAPEDCVLLRVFVGGATAPAAAEQDVDSLQKSVREFLQRTLGIRAAPRFAVVRRYPKSMPQYHVGHLERVDRIEREMAQWKGLALAGNAFHGVGIPDCVRQAEQAAEGVWRHLFPDPAAG